MSNRFYVNYPLAVGPISLEGSEARHLASVRRLRPGDPVCLFNGDGREYSAIVPLLRAQTVTIAEYSTPSPLNRQNGSPRQRRRTLGRWHACGRSRTVRPAAIGLFT